MAQSQVGMPARLVDVFSLASRAKRARAMQRNVNRRIVAVVPRPESHRPRKNICGYVKNHKVSVFLTTFWTSSSHQNEGRYPSIDTARENVIWKVAYAQQNVPTYYTVRACLPGTFVPFE